MLVEEVADLIFTELATSCLSLGAVVIDIPVNENTRCEFRKAIQDYDWQFMRAIYIEAYGYTSVCIEAVEAYMVRIMFPVRFWRTSYASILMSNWCKEFRDVLQYVVGKRSGSTWKEQIGNQTEGLPCI